VSRRNNAYLCGSLGMRKAFSLPRAKKVEVRLGLVSVRLEAGFRLESGRGG
jgi:hypothetical protein